MKKIKILLIILLALSLVPLIINGVVIFNTINDIYNEDEINNYDIAMVLGCGIKNNEPSKMLRDRLNSAISLYENNKINYILITGDHREGYSEIEVMYDYLIANNIPDEVILKDYKGYNTSASMLNYKNEYSDKNLIVITQRYHMYRSLYIAKNINLDVVGVPAKDARYKGQIIRDLREILARCKDFIKAFLM